MAVNFIVNVSSLIISRQCSEELFLRMNFFDVICLKLLITKLIGYATIIGSMMVRFPQIVKLMSSKSSEGLSFAGNTLELCAMSAGSAYGYGNGYPFSAYGESFFLAAQTSFCSFLILYYNQKNLQAYFFSIFYVAIMAYLLSPAAHLPLITAVQASGLPIVLTGKSLQIIANFRNSSTGQLSFISILLILVGSTLRIFTSIEETGDMLVIVQYVVASLCNATLFGQILYYWNSPISATSKKQQ